jgi:hypothetical protein
VKYPFFQERSPRKEVGKDVVGALDIMKLRAKLFYVQLPM